MVIGPRYRPRNITETTHAIEYNILHTQRIHQTHNTSSDDVRQPCKLLDASIADSDSPSLQFHCFKSDLLFHGGRFDYERQFTTFLRHNFPYVPECCAKKLFDDSFAPILELANNNHRCPLRDPSVRYNYFNTVQLHVAPLPWAFEEGGPAMKPASKASVRGLLDSRRVREFVEGGGCRHCVICMEEIETPKSSAVISMPCSHLFHESCIVQWLDSSHVCPLCRYEMPTED